jgi:hypothetical protein
MTSSSTRDGRSRSLTTQRVKELAPSACNTDRTDAWALAELSRRELVPAICLPNPRVRAERVRALASRPCSPPVEVEAARPRTPARTASPAPSPTSSASLAASCRTGCPARAMGTARAGEPPPHRRPRPRDQRLREERPPPTPAYRDRFNAPRPDSAVPPRSPRSTSPALVKAIGPE